MSTFTVKEVAKELHLSERTIRRWIAEEKIKVIHMGTRVVRITQEELDRIKREGF